jgi:hypothetical protein
MKARLFLLLLAAYLGLGMSTKPTITVRFHVETNARDGDSFALPVNLANARRRTHVERIPAISERQVTSIYPFLTGDGSWGCTFKLDAEGRIRLETLSSEQRGLAIVVFTSTKTGLHQVTDMVIDRPVTDGIITIPTGLSDGEVIALQKQFDLIGQKKKSNIFSRRNQSDRAAEIPAWNDDRGRNDARNPTKPVESVTPPPSKRRATMPPPETSRLPEADLPRIAD